MVLVYIFPIMHTPVFETFYQFCKNKSHLILTIKNEALLLDQVVPEIM